jgi:hypothetical protein
MLYISYEPNLPRATLQKIRSLNGASTQSRHSAVLETALIYAISESESVTSSSQSIISQFAKQATLWLAYPSSFLQNPLVIGQCTIIEQIIQQLRRDIITTKLALESAVGPHRTENLQYQPLSWYLASAGSLHRSISEVKCISSL